MVILLVGSVFTFICIVFLSLQGFFSQTWMMEEESLSPLESGFESTKKSNLLSSPFLMLAILFVLFDVELILLLPSLFSMSFLLAENLAWITLLMLMMVTLLAEWFWSGLKWSTSYLGGLAQ